MYRGHKVIFPKNDTVPPVAKTYTTSSDSVLVVYVCMYTAYAVNYARGLFLKNVLTRSFNNRANKLKSSLVKRSQGHPFAFIPGSVKTALPVAKTTSCYQCHACTINMERCLR